MNAAVTPQIPLLLDLIITLAVAIVTVNLVNRIHMPSIVGFLLAGIVIGPSFLGVIHEIHQIEMLAEIGIVLLLFTIGLEFSLGRLRELRRSIILGGGLQILLTTALVTGVASLAGHTFPQAVFFGFLISPSSTAIVLKLYGARGELTTLHGNFAVSVLLFQDLCIAPMVLLTPVLAADGTSSWGKVILPIIAGVAVISIVVLSARFFLPRIIDHVVRMRNQEIFTLFIILLCLGTAWLTSRLGLSLALGAFIAGLLLSESEYSYQALANILPLRDSFAGLFFISIGMLLNLQTALDAPWHVLGLAALILGGKMFVVFIVMVMLRCSSRTSISGALGLAQIGEFSFVLAQAGLNYGLLSPITYQRFLASAIISMMAAPFLILIAPKAGFRLQPFLGWLDTLVGAASKAGAEEEKEKYARQDHVVIIGYGENGRNLARVLQATAIPYVIIDLNILNVRKGKETGHTIYYGDAGSPEILKRAAISRARLAVIAISDPSAIQKITWLIRHMNSEIFLIVRTQYVAEIEELYKLGASQVIPQEFETSVEIFSHVLRQFHIPRNMIELQVQLIRNQGYSMLRGLNLPDLRFKHIQHLIAETLTENFLVLPQSPAIGKTLGELHLRLKTGVTVIAVIRGDEAISSPGSNTAVESGDILVMMGNHAALDRAIEILSPKDPAIDSPSPSLRERDW
ncbi:MAG: cation:proton antiporter [bacterium]